MDSSFDRAANGKCEWLTPPELIRALGDFDLDPCAPINPPWATAKKQYTIQDDGLRQPWEGRVWLNPPYGNETESWLRKLAHHGDGVALIFARTDTTTWQRWIFPYASAVFFIKGRLRFYNVDGTQSGPAGAPSAIIAYGSHNAEMVQRCGLVGAFITLTQEKRT